MVCPEQLTGPQPSKVLDFIDVLASPIVPATGVPLGILVRQDRAQRLENSLGHKIFAGDELQSTSLTMSLGLNKPSNGRIDFPERRH
jgi:hypothetical protein